MKINDVEFYDRVGGFDIDLLTDLHQCIEPIAVRKVRVGSKTFAAAIPIPTRVHFANEPRTIREKLVRKKPVPVYRKEFDFERAVRELHEVEMPS